MADVFLDSIRSMAAIGILAFLPAGCGGPAPEAVPLPKEMGLVEGTVLMDGRPLAGALVVFLPPLESDPWRESKGVTDDKGHYELTYYDEVKGATPGKNAVRITCPDPNDIERQIVPSQYNLKSELERDVVPGANSIDFQLSGEEK